MTPSRLSQALQEQTPARLLVVGDLILDAYLRGSVGRISPEAPVPVLESASRTLALGGAANVAHNLLTCGAQVQLAGVVGDDEEGRALRRLLHATGLSTDGLVTAARQPTAHKLRLLAGGQHMLRIDREASSALDNEARNQVAQMVAKSLPQTQVLVLSDYRKGVLAPALCAALIDQARAAGVPVVIDPKGRDYTAYAGATVLTPNLAELEAASGQSLAGKPEARDRVAREMCCDLKLDALLVTCGREGMVLIEGEQPPVAIPARAREVYDVTGAGDTVLALLALGLAWGAPLADAARMANAGGGLVVGKSGTAVVTRQELIEVLDQTSVPPPADSKVLSLAQAQAYVRRVRRGGGSVVFTNGCFDVLHVGHVRFLQQAREQGAALVVGLNTDASVRALKGNGRPLVAFEERAEVLAGLACVDGVVGFADPTPAALIKALQPDVLVKGADYAADEVVGREWVEASGGKLILLPLTECRSTTRLVEEIRRRYA